jgi:L-2-hydroxyglutarate oxidase LhgO
LSSEVTDFKRNADNSWHVTIKNVQSGEEQAIDAKYVFIGAGGGALKLLQKTGIPEADNKIGDFRRGLQREVAALFQATDQLTGNFTVVHIGTFIGAGGGALKLLQKTGIPEADNYAGFPVGGSFLMTRHVPGVVGIAFKIGDFRRGLQREVAALFQATDQLTGIKQWAPLVMEGRDPQQKVAATWTPVGTDVNYGEITALHVLNRHVPGVVGIAFKIGDFRRGLQREVAAPYSRE